MKRKSMLAALAVLLMTSDVRAATCPETLSLVIGPDFTCVSLTDRLLERFPPDVNHFAPNGIPYLQQIRFSLRNHWGRGRSWPRAIRQI
jgi:hypothetical protein